MSHASYWKDEAARLDERLAEARRELREATAYAERIAEVATTIRDQAHAEFIELGRWLPISNEQLAALDAALAKNPNPSGHLTAEAAPTPTGTASGSVGLGPHKEFQMGHAFVDAQDDARDAARYRWLRHRTGAGTYQGQGGWGSTMSFPTVDLERSHDWMRGSVAQHLDAAIDLRIAKDGAETPPSQ